MGDYTGKQQMYLCCGYFCSMLACIGVYFWLVMFYMQATKSPYLIYELEQISMQDTDEINTYKWAFFITIFLNIACCVACGWCTTFIQKPEDEPEEDLDIRLPPPLPREAPFTRQSEQAPQYNTALQRQSNVSSPQLIE